MGEGFTNKPLGAPPLAGESFSLSEHPPYSREEHPMTSTLILKGMTLIDGTGRPPQEHVILAIRNGRVLYVGDAAGWIGEPDEPATVLDLPGNFVLPGLIDCHVHLPDDESP